MRKYKPFKFWVQSVLPLVYDDSLSYYELLAKVVFYINGLIKDYDELIELNEDLEADFNELKEYVDNYFDSTDFQQLVEDKLDEMAEDGTLEEIIERVTRPHIYWVDYESDISISQQLANAKNEGYTAAEFVINKDAQPIVINEPIVVPSGMTLNGNGAILYAHNRSSSRTIIYPIFDLRDKNWVKINGFRLGIDNIIFYPPSPIYDSPNPSPMIVVDNSNHVDFSNIEIEDYYTNIDTSIAVGYTYSNGELWSVALLRACNYVNFFKFNVINFYDEGITLVDSNHINFLECEFHGADLTIDNRSYTPLNIFNTNYVTVDGCFIDHYSQTSIMNIYGSELTFTNSTFIDHDGHESGIDIGNEINLNVETFYNVKFSDCYIKSWFNSFHKNQRHENFVIENCYIDATVAANYAVACTSGTTLIANSFIKASVYVFLAFDEAEISSFGNHYVVTDNQAPSIFRYYTDVAINFKSENDTSEAILVYFSLNNHADLTKASNVEIINFHGARVLNANNPNDVIDAKTFKVTIKDCNDMGSMSIIPAMTLKYINNIFKPTSNLCVGLYNDSEIEMIGNLIDGNAFLLYLFNGSEGCSGTIANNVVQGINQGYIVGGLQAAGQNNDLVCFNNLPEKSARVANAKYGTNAERPDTTYNGMVRFNTTTGKLERYDGGWYDIT